MTAGMQCTSSGQCVFGYYCGLGNGTNGTVCMAKVPMNGDCTTGPCYPGNFCNSGKCVAMYSLSGGAACTSAGQCSVDLVCATNGTCVNADTELTECSEDSDCTESNSVCKCSPFTQKFYCTTTLLDPCTEEESDLSSCMASSNCSTATNAPNSCCYNECYSDYKKTLSCSCSNDSDLYGNCQYNSFCGGFPVWAIILIIVVAIVLVLAIVLLVFFMMRRKPHYDAI